MTTPADNGYNKSLSDKFWLTLYGNIVKDQGRLDQSLQNAALNNNLWRAEFLLSRKKANPNSGDGFCVRWAAEDGHCEMIRLLARHGADMNAKDGQALINAASRGHVDVAKTLLENGADATRQDYAALRTADAANDTAFIRTLLNSGQDFTRVANELLGAADGIGAFDKAGLYRQYLDSRAKPSAGMTIKPPKP